jgi:hypothetical protein
LKRVIYYSGGDASRFTALMVAREHGTEDADVFIEDRDLYRVLIESAAYLFGLKGKRRRLVGRLLNRLKRLPPLAKIEARKKFLLKLASDTRSLMPRLVWIAEGRTPWDVFRDVRFIGNSRVDPCSRILKRDFLRKWTEKNCDPADTILYFGLDANEGHRLGGVRQRLTGWRCEAPMVDAFIFKEQVRAELEKTGVRRSRSYELGASHDNCSMTCVKAGQGSWKLALTKRPEAYAYAESEEIRTKAVIGRADIGVLKDRRGGESKALDLTTFRERVQAGAQVDMFDIGGCGCAV